jgi:hypothetical protein
MASINQATEVQALFEFGIAHLRTMPQLEKWGQTDTIPCWMRGSFRIT